MKILLFTLEYPPQIGGIANYYGNLAQAWPQPQDFQVLIASQDKQFARASFYRWPHLAHRLANRLRAAKIDHVLVGEILPLGPIVRLAQLQYKFSYSIFLHGLDFSDANRYWRKRLISRQVLVGAKQIICANSFLAQQVKARQPAVADKIFVLNPGAKVETVSLSEVQTFLEKYRLVDKKIIFSLGRLVPRKGFDQVIKALAIIRQQAPDLFSQSVYLLTGEGPDKERLQTLVQEQQLTDKVIFLGSFSGQSKSAAFQASDLFVMPARQIGDDYEGFGIVYLEANLFGKPVIAGQSGGVFEAVADGESGYLLPPEDTNLLATKIIDLLTNPQLASKLGEQGRKRAQKLFNWSAQAQKLADFLAK